MFSILPPASIALILLYFFFVFPQGRYDTWKKCLVIHLVCILFFQTGYFIKIGSISFSHAEVTLFILVVAMMASGGVSLTASNIALFIVVLIGWISCSLFPSDYPSVPVGVFWTFSNAVIPAFSYSYIKYFVRLLLFFLVANQLPNHVSDDEIAVFCDFVVKIEKLILILIALEFITKNMMGSNISETLKRTVFGYITTDSWQNPAIFYRGGTAALSGLFFEPSAFAWSQLMVGIIALKSSYARKKLMVLAIIIFQLLSVSFSSALTVLCLVSFIVFENSVIGGIAFAVVSLFALLLFISIGEQAGADTLVGYYYNRVFQSLDTLKILQSNSSINEMQQEMRLVAIAESLKSFAKRPLFGVGLGANYSYSLIPTALANIGLIGFTVWMNSVMKITNLFRNHRGSIELIILFVVYFFIGTIGSMYDLGLLTILIVVVNCGKGQDS